VGFLERETPEFISPLLWHPNLPYLNPVDYNVWSILQEKVYKTCIIHLNHLKDRIRTGWARWITPLLLQLCVIGVVIFQLMSWSAVVISSTAFNFDIVFFEITAAFEAFVD